MQELSWGFGVLGSNTSRQTGLQLQGYAIRGMPFRVCRHFNTTPIVGPKPSADSLPGRPTSLNPLPLPQCLLLLHQGCRLRRSAMLHHCCQQMQY